MSRDRMLLTLFMTLLMGMVMSAVFTWQALGFAAGFVSAWFSRFSSTYIIVLPTVLLVSPVAQWMAVRADGLFGRSEDSVAVALTAWRANASRDTAQVYHEITAANPQLIDEKPFRTTSAGSTVVLEFDYRDAIEGMPHRARIAASFDIEGGKVTAYRGYVGDLDPGVISMMARTSPKGQRSIPG